LDSVFLLGEFSENGVFIRYVRKSRNNNIVGYDTLSSAKRGLSHSNKNSNYTGKFKILKFKPSSIIEGVI
jgi:hypothetical protein